MCEGDAASLLMALAACLLGYGEVGLWLQREARRPKTWVQYLKHLGQNDELTPCAHRDAFPNSEQNIVTSI